MNRYRGSSLSVITRLLLLALILPAHAAVASQPTCGIILMHGKWGMPQSPYLKPVVEKLSPDCRVVLLEMPWSRKRLYDKPYRDALQQIKAAVDSLRQSGAQWIAVGGQSFGANAALAYMAQVGDVDAIIPLAPGHVPETFYRDSDISRVVDESSRLVHSGKGDTLLELNDMNQGRRQSLNTRRRLCLSSGQSVILTRSMGRFQRKFIEGCQQIPAAFISKSAPITRQRQKRLRKPWVSGWQRVRCAELVWLPHPPPVRRRRAPHRPSNWASRTA